MPRMRTIKILILKITFSNFTILFVKLLIVSISDNISSIHLHFQYSFDVHIPEYALLTSSCIS